jgi:hypothetical protein
MTGPFATLDPGLPLLLLPVRVDTRYRLDADPPELRLRILPDQVHVVADEAAPGETESALTMQFWRAWHEAGNAARQRAAWRRFVRRVGATRAGHLARLLRPRQAGDGSLLFPALNGSAPTTGPQLLPHHWIAVGYRDGTAVFRQSSRPIPAGLQTGPDPAAPAWEAGDSGLRVDEGMAWLVDYDRAVAAGMAITVPLTGASAAAADGLDTLLVVGVMSNVEPEAVAERLDHLLRGHARGSGLAFVPQGTPTNNTGTATSGWSPDSVDFADLAERELEPRPAAPGSNANRLAHALGLADETTLRRLPGGADRERGRSRAMVRVTFEALLGTMMRRLLRVGTTNGVSPASANAVRDWCIEYVTGGAHYACLRIGAQPYGVLPVQRSTDPAGPLPRVLALLGREWRQAAARLPVLDHNRGERRPDRAAADTATALAVQPHSGSTTPLSWAASTRRRTRTSLRPSSRSVSSTGPPRRGGRSTASRTSSTCGGPSVHSCPATSGSGDWARTSTKAPAGSTRSSRSSTGTPGASDRSGSSSSRRTPACSASRPPRWSKECCGHRRQNGVRSV